MKLYLQYSLALILSFTTFISCQKKAYQAKNTDTDSSTVSSPIKFIGEQVIPANQKIDGLEIGGLSGIDYANGKYYVICDDSSNPRFYEMELVFDKNSFSKAIVTKQILLKDESGDFKNKTVDPESIRFSDGNLVWTSEGQIRKGITPFVRIATPNGAFVKAFELPEIFKENNNSKGFRHNGVFEGLTISYDKKGYWVSTELPLKQDGIPPVFEQYTNSPVRVSYFDKNGKFGKQFAYSLEPVSKNGRTNINGLVEILAYEKDKFLFVERSFSSGIKEGNNVKIYKVDASKASDISSFKSLKGATYTYASKELLFDFESIRSKLSKVGNTHIVDNIEGITFGSKLSNGNQTLALISDNNFNRYGSQLSQIIVLEVLDL